MKIINIPSTNPAHSHTISTKPLFAHALFRLLKDQKDHNTAALSLFMMRLLLSLPETDTVNVVGKSNEVLNYMLRSDLATTNAHVRVEMCRVLASPRLLEREGSVTASLECIRFCSFVLASDFEVLHEEFMDYVQHLPPSLKNIGDMDWDVVEGVSLKDRLKALEDKKE